jgi:hypothetical protein
VNAPKERIGRQVGLGGNTEVNNDGTEVPLSIHHSVPPGTTPKLARVNRCS